MYVYIHNFETATNLAKKTSEEHPSVFNQKKWKEQAFKDIKMKFIGFVPPLIM